MADPAPRIRFAMEADVPLLLGFIRDLADYEKLVHLVEADEDRLRRTLFGDIPRAEALIAEMDGRPAGFALFFHSYSTFLAKPGLYLEDLYVSPEYRGQGLGKALLKRLAALAVERDCGRFEWSVLDWNEDAIGFYRALGARPVEGWTVYRVDGAALTALAEGGKDIS